MRLIYDINVLTRIIRIILIRGAIDVGGIDCDAVGSNQASQCRLPSICRAIPGSREHTPILNAPRAQEGRTQADHADGSAQINLTRACRSTPVYKGTTQRVSRNTLI